MQIERQLTTLVPQSQGMGMKRMREYTFQNCALHFTSISCWRYDHGNPMVPSFSMPSFAFVQSGPSSLVTQEGGLQLKKARPAAIPLHNEPALCLIRPH